MVTEASNIYRAVNADELGELLAMNIKAPQDGYMYIYVTNESAKDVSFDNLHIRHTNGAVLEINHYYPYGQLITDLSQQSVTSLPNKYKYTTKELEDFIDLRMYDHGARMYDPLLARWVVQDPAYQSYNPYMAMGDNPCGYIDPDGQWINLVAGAFFGGTLNWMAHGAQFNAKGLGYFGVGALAGAVGAGIGSGVSSAFVSAAKGGGFIAGFTGTATATGTGFATGFVSGASGGGASGFVTGFGNAAVESKKIDEMFSTGIDYSRNGALAGAVIGGIMGGIDAVNNDQDFLTGARRDNYVFQINENGSVNEINVKDYDPGKSTYKNNYDTRFTNNPNVTQVSNSDGTVTITIKKPEYYKATGMSDPNKTLLSFSDNGKTLTINTLDRVNSGTFYGSKFQSQPINGLQDLFHWRDINKRALFFWNGR